jgi:hypothetical protein
MFGFHKEISDSRLPWRKGVKEVTLSRFGMCFIRAKITGMRATMYRTSFPAARMMSKMREMAALMKRLLKGSVMLGVESCDEEASDC